MIRELSNITERKVYRDDSEIELALMLSKGNIIENQAITQSASQFMVEGESRVDLISNLSVVKINGILKKLVLDDDNNIIYQEI